MDLSIVSLAVRLRLERRTITDIRIASGGTGSAPLRLREAERALRGTRGEDPSLRLAAEAAAAECRPSDDIRGSARYKTDMVKVHLVRVMKEITA
jgi:carbon-monoxide dehydrogenase medium subunit